MKDLPNLDLLRAVAVLTVFVEHVLLAYNVQYIGSWEVQWIGVVGVFIFFVHTALVLMWSLERKPHTLDFYIRRIFRIYPLAILTICVVLLFHAPVGGTPAHFFRYLPPPGSHALIRAFLLIPNLGPPNPGYLPSGVMWSLPYEVQMYLLLPVVYFFVRSNFTLWPLLLLWLFDILVCETLFPGQPHNFFLVIPYFLPGIMAYIGFGRQKAVLPAWIFPFALIALWGAFMLHPGWRIANVLCLALGLGLPFFHQITRRPLMVVSHTIAKYSYGIYLAHPFSIVLGLYLMPHAPLALQLTVMVVTTAAFAVAGYHLLEHPMIQLGARLAKRIEKRYEQHEHTAFNPIPEAEIR